MTPVEEGERGGERRGGEKRGGEGERERERGGEERSEDRRIGEETGESLQRLLAAHYLPRPSIKA